MVCGGVCSTTDQRSEALQRWVGVKTGFCQMPSPLYKGSLAKPPPHNALAVVTAKRWHCSIHHPFPRSTRAGACLEQGLSSHPGAYFHHKKSPLSLDSKNKGKKKKLTELENLISWRIENSQVTGFTDPLLWLCWDVPKQLVQSVVWSSWSPTKTETWNLKKFEARWLNSWFQE